MLSIFRGEGDSAFALWVSDRASGIDLVVSDGSRVWSSREVIDASTKPASRKHEADEEYLIQLRKALRKNETDVSSSFDVELRPGEDGLRMTMKETIGTTSTKSILFKTTLPTVDIPEEGIMQLLGQISYRMQKDAVHVATQNKALAEYASLVDTLRGDTREMATMKDKLQDEMIAKMCMVLNCKKREIERLSERVAELEAAGEGSDHANDVVQVSQQTASSARGKAAAVKPKAAPRKAATAAAAKAAIKKAAVATAKKPAPRRKQKAASSSDEEDDDGADGSDSESSDAGMDGTGQDSAEDDSADMETGGDSDEGSVPMVTQSSAGNTLQSPASTLTSTSRYHHAGAASQPDAHTSANHHTSAGPGVARVTLSLPIDTSPVKHDKRPVEDESDEDILPAKRRRAATSQVTQPVGNSQSPALAKGVAAKGAPATQQSRSSSATTVPTMQKGSASGGGSSGALSKFYAEDSDEDSNNCLAFM